MSYLIVGGTAGIGNEIVRRLSSKGNKVFVTGRTQKNLDEINNVDFYEWNSEDENSQLPEISEPLSGIVYCPGTIILKPFKNLTDNDFLYEYTVNLLGAVRVIRKYLPNLKSSENSAIVLFSTVAVQMGMSFHSSIASAKGAIEGLTRSLAAEFAPSIRVNCIAPSLTDTALAGKLLGNEEKRDAAAKRHPLNKFGTVEDIASAAVYLLSSDSGWITGQIMSVDGGMSSVKTF
ncbi:MAG: SDR family oxidoreductase [Ignavibacteriaceae bacterium]|nr:SDR family oxidoreductase [Ignavibacteriaceae bacterium]